jgi:hypothetical protein
LSVAAWAGFSAVPLAEGRLTTVSPKREFPKDS